MSPSSAKRSLEAGRRMADQPEVARAALAGELSPEQAAAVSDGVAANPARAAELIDRAKVASLPELNEEVARTKAAATDAEARRRAIHARRALRRWTDRDGAVHAHLYGHPEDGAALWRMLDPIRRRLNVLRRGSTPNESLDALDYDAIVAMASIAAGAEGELSMGDLLDLGLFPQLDSAVATRRPSASPGVPGLAPTAMPSTAMPARTTSGDEPDLFSAVEGTDPPGDVPGPPDGDPPEPGGEAATPTGSPDAHRGRRRAKRLAGGPARVMIRVDLDALLRGLPLDGELCEIAGYGPVPVSVVDDLVASGNAFVVGVYHHGRRPNAHQRSALDFRYPSCAVAGCLARAGLQYDHREDFAKTRFTVFDLLDRLCPHHHSLKTRKGWGLVEGSGKRAFVPPDDPRHLRHLPNLRQPGMTREAGPAPPVRSR